MRQRVRTSWGSFVSDVFQLVMELDRAVYYHLYCSLFTLMFCCCDLKDLDMVVMSDVNFLESWAQLMT